MLPRINWEDHVHFGRGIEIGKRGLTVRCDTCGQHRPIRGMTVPQMCKFCGAVLSDPSTITIISKSPNGPGWTNLIVGEDIDRYSATPSRAIKLDVPGIRYKPWEHFRTKKLLIKKTGVGIRTATDETNAAAIQAVFYVTPKEARNSWLVDYLQGILNSRPMLAWYLRWSGENRWRSHPYVTPSVLKDLPVPEPFSDSRLWDVAQAIAAKATRARHGDKDADHEVDHLTYLLFDLDAEAREWVCRVLQDTDDSLEYFQRMRQMRTPNLASRPSSREPSLVRPLTPGFAPLPHGPFITVVADPPWDYSRKLSGGGTSGYSPVHHSRGGNRGAANHYPTLTMDQLKSLPVESVVADQAHLYLWTTSSFVVEAHDLADAWGFSPKVLIPWIKMKRSSESEITAAGGSPYAGVRMGMGLYIRHCAEFLLFAVRGKAPTARNNALGVIFAAQGRHSEKPEEAYDLIDSLSSSPKLELFARSPRTGYEVWGDESSTLSVGTFSDK